MVAPVESSGVAVVGGTPDPKGVMTKGEEELGKEGRQ